MVFFVFIVSYNVFVVRGCQGLNFFLRRCKVYVKYYRVNFKNFIVLILMKKYLKINFGK